jgi:hypothetical protein
MLQPAPKVVIPDIDIYTTFPHKKTMSYGSTKLPLLLERAGVRRIKSSSTFPSSQPSPFGEGAVGLV